MKKLLILSTSLTLFAGITSNDLLNYTFKGEYDAKKGEELYIKTYKCNGCHGIKGERASGTFPKLNELTASSLKASLKAYKTDKDYGGKTRAAMQRYAVKLSNDDIDNIVVYLKGNDLYLDNDPDKEPDKITKDNLYIE